VSQKVGLSGGVFNMTDHKGATAVRDDDTALLVTEKTAAKKMSVSPAMLVAARFRKRPLLPFVRVGSRAIRYRLSDIDDFIDRNTVVPALECERAPVGRQSILRDERARCITPIEASPDYSAPTSQVQKVRLVRRRSAKGTQSNSGGDASLKAFARTPQPNTPSTSKRRST
jgi:hypothetical protein